MRNLNFTNRVVKLFAFTFSAALISCQDEPGNPIDSLPSAVTLSKVAEVRYDYGLGTNQSAASDGQRIVLSSLSGTFTLHGKTATGIGFYDQYDASNNLIRSGIWVANDLISFHSYGPSDPNASLPRAEGGRANLRISLAPGLDGSSGSEGTLEIVSTVGNSPPSVVDGITLRAHRGPSYSQVLIGSTQFIRQP